MMKTTFQRIGAELDGNMALAERYYSVLFTINDIHLTERELQLVAFTAIRGNMTYANIREDFCKRYSTTSPTINNMISRLKRLGIFIKEASKVRINSGIVLNFDNDIRMEINLTHGQASNINS